MFCDIIYHYYLVQVKGLIPYPLIKEAESKRETERDRDRVRDRDRQAETETERVRQT